MIKYYRKKGTDKATHQMIYDNYKTLFINLKKKEVEQGFVHKRTSIGFPLEIWSCDEFNQFLEKNDFEEVMDDSKTPDPNATFTGKLEGKLHFGEKVDRALEEVKFVLSDDANFSNNLIQAAVIRDKAQNLVNAIEEEKQPNDNLKQSFEDYKNKENLTVCENMEEFKGSVKLPEVRKRYRDKETKKIKDFWEFFEELPEDNIEKPDGMVKIFPDICDEDVEPIPTKARLAENAKSIWKDVSELPEDDVFLCILKLNTGHITIAQYQYDEQDNDAYFIEHCAYSHTYPTITVKGDLILMEDVVEYCTLTDYINNTEERLRKLEGK